MHFHAVIAIFLDENKQAGMFPGHRDGSARLSEVIVAAK